MKSELQEIEGDYPKGIPDLKHLLSQGYDHETLNRYFNKVTLHVRAVQAAGRELGVRQAQIKTHDLSKFSWDEFGPYAAHFEGGGAPSAFERAWLHHIHENPHHWEHWIFPNGFALKGGKSEAGVMPMPEHYILEMVADWYGAGYAYSGGWNMETWLRGHMQKITLHTQTASHLRAILASVGYDFVYDLRFAHELKHVDVAEEVK